MSKEKLTFRQWLGHHKPTKRRIIQLYAALLTNANLKGFKSGRIYSGSVKSICTPGLNCYSCPAASASCPLGALQNALADSGARFPYYILGILLLFGILFGRWICGFLCPFGLIQDLLHKIKTPKLKKCLATQVLSYLKYIILMVFVVMIPLIYAAHSFPLPAFCKYICPSGTLTGAGGLLSNENNSYMFSMLGSLFTWKFCLLVVFIVAAVFIYRFFCRFFCPLGAIYGLFNRLSILGIKLEKPKCVDCGLCISTCPMDIRNVGDHECISCGKCINVCPTNAISYKGPKILLAPNAVGDHSSAQTLNKTGSSCTVKTALPKKTKIARIIVGSIMLALLTGTLIHYNFVDVSGNTPPEGNQIGELCYSLDLNLYGDDRTVSVQDSRGKVTVLNFWYVRCGPCIEELQHEFPRIKDEYKDQVEIIAVHSYEEYGYHVPDFIAENFHGADFTFCRDVQDDAYFSMLGGGQAWPMTVVLDKDGVIVSTIYGSTTYNELKEIIEPLISQ